MTEFKVENMSCGHCVAAISRAVRAVDPDAGVRVDLARGAVAVESGLAAARVAEAIRSAGYPAEVA